MSSIPLASFLSFPRSLSTSHYQVSYPMMLFFSLQKFFFLATSSYVIIQFYIPFLSVFLRVGCPVNYAPKHRLPLFALSLSSPAATLYFFVRFNYESPLFTSLNEFYRIEFYSLAFLTRCPFSSLHPRSPLPFPRISYPFAQSENLLRSSSSFLCFPRPGVIDTSDSLPRWTLLRSTSALPRKRTAESVCIVYSRTRPELPGIVSRVFYEERLEFL